MLSARDIVLEYACPLAGVCCAAVMYSAPYWDVRKAIREQGTLGDLNPTPWAVMLGNTIGWVAYAYVRHNWFVFWGDAPGLLMSVWLNLQACKLQYQDHQSQVLRKSIVQALQESSQPFLSKQIEKPAVATSSDSATPTVDFAQVVLNVPSTLTPAPVAHENLIMAFLIFYLALFTVLIMFQVDQSRQEFVLGVTVNLNFVFFYGAPLSTLWQVLLTHSSSTIHIPTLLFNTAHGAFWCAYAAAVLDPFIAIPNAVGVVLGVVQMILCVIFPRTTNNEPLSNETTTDKDNAKIAKLNDNDDGCVEDKPSVNPTVQLDTSQKETETTLSDSDMQSSQHVEILRADNSSPHNAVAITISEE
jgi:solute carrier family 50 (sugar transporter)